MKHTVMMAVFAALSLCLAAAQTADPPRTSPPGASLERPFAPGGTVRMKLTAGTYEIRRGADDGKILMRWTAMRAEDLKRVQVSVEVKGSEASIATRGIKKNVRVEIELPAHTDLVVRLSAGDLDIRGMEGNKDVECHAGDISIDIGRAQDYRRIDASVKVGDIEAPPILISKGGFFRSATWPGTGKYLLHAHVGAGSLTLLGAR